jgi:hypothetical protein
MKPEPHYFYGAGAKEVTRCGFGSDNDVKQREDTIL